MKKIEEMLQEELLVYAQTVTKELNDLKTEHDGCASKISDLQTENGMLSEDLEKKEKMIVQLNNVIAEAGAETKTASSTQEITVDEVVYLVRRERFRLPKDAKEYSAADLAKDQKLVERVLSIDKQKILEKKQ